MWDRMIKIIRGNKVIMGITVNTMAVVCMLILNLPACAAFVLPDQEVKLELYDDWSPIVKFPARHQGRVENEVFVEPPKVKISIPVVDYIGKEEESISDVLPVSPEKHKKKKKKKKKQGKKKKQSKTASKTKKTKKNGGKIKRKEQEM